MGSFQRDDEEIQLGVQTLSFACPLSLMRISHPGKGKHCKHKQCFDLKVFLKYHERKPLSKWKCTICNMSVTPGTLVADYKFKGYLLRFPDEDRCVVHPDGTCSTVESFQRSTGGDTVSREDTSNCRKRKAVCLDLVTDSEGDEEEEEIREKKEGDAKRGERASRNENYRGLPEKWCVACKKRFPLAHTNRCDLCIDPPPLPSSSSPRKKDANPPDEFPARQPRHQNELVDRFRREETSHRSGSPTKTAPPSRKRPRDERPSSTSPRTGRLRGDTSLPPPPSAHRQRPRQLLDVSLARPDVIIID